MEEIKEVSKNRVNYPLIKFLFVLFGLVTFYYLLLDQQFLVYGDLSTAFQYNVKNFFPSYPNLWISNDFLGYDAAFYSLMRIPNYLFRNSLIFLFGRNKYYLYFSFVSFLNFFSFFTFLNFLKIKLSENSKLIVSILYPFSIFFLERFFHILIPFAVAFLPLYFIFLFKSYKKPVFKNIFLLNFLLFFIFSSMHVSFIVFYCSLFFVIYVFLFERDIYRLKRFLIRFALVFFPLFLYLLLPIFFSSTGLLSNVSSYASKLIQPPQVVNPLLYLVGSGLLSIQDIVDSWEVVLRVNVFLIAPQVIVGFVWSRFGKKTRKDFKWEFFQVLFVIFWFLAIYKLVDGFIPFLRSYFPLFSAIKHLSYFAILINLLSFVFLSYFLSKCMQKIKVILLTFLTVLTVINSLIFFDFVKDISLDLLPMDLQAVNKIVDNTDKRVLFLPFNWVVELNWARENILSGFFNRYYSNVNKVGQTIVETSNPGSNDFQREFYWCLKRNCSEIGKYFNWLGIGYVVDFDNSRYMKSLDLSNTMVYEGNNAEVYRIEGVSGMLTSDGRDLEYGLGNFSNTRVPVLKASSGKLFLRETYNSNWVLVPEVKEKVIERCSEANSIGCIGSSPYLLKRVLRKSVTPQPAIPAYNYGNLWKMDHEVVRGMIVYTPQIIFDVCLLISIILGPFYLIFISKRFRKDL